LNLNLIIKSSVVGNLILLFHKVQLFLYSKVVLVAVLSDLKENLDHVLGSFVNISFVQNAAKLVVDSHGDLRVELLDMLANFSHQSYGNFDTIISRLVQQQQKHLSGKHLVRDLLVDEVGQESGAAQANSLVIALEGLAELNYQAIDQQLANLRELGVDNSNHSGVDGCKRQTGSLSLHDATAKETTTADEVLAK
jgi:hypothetical protein